MALQIVKPNEPKIMAFIFCAVWPLTLTTILLIALIKKAAE